MKHLMLFEELNENFFDYNNTNKSLIEDFIKKINDKLASNKLRYEVIPYYSNDDEKIESNTYRIDAYNSMWHIFIKLNDKLLILDPINLDKNGVETLISNGFTRKATNLYKKLQKTTKKI